MSRALLLGYFDQAGDRFPLMKARKDHRLDVVFLAFFVRLFLNRQMHETPQDIEKGRALEHTLPQVADSVSVRIRWIAGAVIVAQVERQKVGGLPGKASSHLHLSCADAEVNQRATFELQQRLVLVGLRIADRAVFPILLDCVVD